jgi:hypothetical protein
MSSLDSSPMDEGRDPESEGEGAEESARPMRQAPKTLSAGYIDPAEDAKELAALSGEAGAEVDDPDNGDEEPDDESDEPSAEDTRITEAVDAYMGHYAHCAICLEAETTSGWCPEGKALWLHIPEGIRSEIHRAETEYGDPLPIPRELIAQGPRLLLEAVYGDPPEGTIWCERCNGNAVHPTEKPQDPDTRKCQTCEGLGEVTTGSLVPQNRYRTCATCNGFGYMVNEHSPAASPQGHPPIVSVPLEENGEKVDIDFGEIPDVSRYVSPAR